MELAGVPGTRLRPGNMCLGISSPTRPRVTFTDSKSEQLSRRPISPHNISILASSHAVKHVLPSQRYFYTLTQERISLQAPSRRLHPTYSTRRQTTKLETGIPHSLYRPMKNKSRQLQPRLTRVSGHFPLISLACSPIGHRRSPIPSPIFSDLQSKAQYNLGF